MFDMIAGTAGYGIPWTSEYITTDIDQFSSIEKIIGSNFDDQVIASDQGACCRMGSNPVDVRLPRAAGLIPSGEVTHDGVGDGEFLSRAGSAAAVPASG
ncbi:hypothetical protein ACFQ4K_02660 [Tistrella bauzanensis]